MAEELGPRMTLHLADAGFTISAFSSSPMLKMALQSETPDKKATAKCTSNPSELLSAARTSSQLIWPSPLDGRLHSIVAGSQV